MSFFPCINVRYANHISGVRLGPKPVRSHHRNTSSYNCSLIEAFRPLHASIITIASASRRTKISCTLKGVSKPSLPGKQWNISNQTCQPHTNREKPPDRTGKSSCLPKPSDAADILAALQPCSFRIKKLSSNSSTSNTLLDQFPQPSCSPHARSLARFLAPPRVELSPQPPPM